MNNIEYCGDIQVWGITSSDDGYTFLATAQGLSVWDGVRWSGYQTPFATYLRALYYDRDAKILYSAGNNEFGYWVEDAYGEFQYVRLFANTDLGAIRIFWRIIARGEYVYFQCHEGISQYDRKSGQIKTVDFGGRYLDYAHLAGDDLYIQLDGKFFLLADNLSFTPAGIDYATRIVSLHASPSGDILLFTESAGLQMIAGGKLATKQFGCNKVFANEKIFCATALDTNTYAVGTIGNGLYIVDHKGEIVNHIRPRELNSSTVLCAHADSVGRVWVGLDAGIAFYKPHALNEFYYRSDKDPGSVYSSAMYDDLLFLGTNKGLFYVDRTQKLHFVEGSQGQIWNLIALPGALYICHDRGIMTYSEGRLGTTSYHGAWEITPYRDNLYLSTDYYGASLYTLRNGKLEWRNKIAGLNGSFRKLVVDKYANIWGLGLNGECFKITLDEQKHNAAHIRSYAIDPQSQPSMAVLDSEPVFYTKDNAYTYDIAQDSVVVNNHYSALIGLCGAAPLAIAQRGHSFLAIVDNRIMRIERNSNQFIHLGEVMHSGRHLMIPIDFREFEFLTPSQVAVGLRGGIDIYDFDVPANQPHGTLYLRQFKCLTAGRWRALKIDQPEVRVPANTKEIRIFLRGQRSSTSVDYSFDNQQWTRTSVEDYLSISEFPTGTFTLSIRDAVSPDQTLAIEVSVNKPWYLRLWVILLFVVAAGVVVGVVFKAALKRSQHDNRQVIAEQQREMQKQQKEYELEMMRLTLKERDKKLAEHTINEINRNNILIAIRKDIEFLQSNLNNAPERIAQGILRKIDQQLNSNSGWEQFRQYYNSMYDGYFDRLVQRCGKITTNDMKLCAYLRMGLSTKEIAALMNISATSVEIARHRLRKKLDLGATESLTRFLADI